MFHRFRPELAKKYGLPEAVLLYYVEFWCQQNAEKNRDDAFHDGRWWVYHSAPAIAEELGYLSPTQVKRLMQRLVDCGALIAGNFNKKNLDRTRWYTLGDDVLRWCKIEPSGAPPIVQNCTVDGSNLNHARCKIDPPIQIIKVNNKSNYKNAAGGASGACAGSPRWRSALATLEAVWGLTLDARVAARIGSLVDDFGEEVLLKAITKAVRANERQPIQAGRVVNYISKTCAGLANGVDFDSVYSRGGNNVAAAAEAVQRRLDEEGGSSGGNDSAECSDPVWGVWGSQG